MVSMCIMMKMRRKKMKSNYWQAIYCLCVGMVFFVIFAYDVENDRDFWTWLWLLNSQINFLTSLRYFIKYDRESGNKS